MLLKIVGIGILTGWEVSLLWAVFNSNLQHDWGIWFIWFLWGIVLPGELYLQNRKLNRVWAEREQAIRCQKNH